MFRTLRKAVGSLLILAVGFGLLSALGCGNARDKAYERGKIHARRGDPKAITDFRKAVDMDPEFYDARLKLAEAYLARGSAEDLETAKTELKKCLDRKPDDLQPWLMLVGAALKGEKPNFSEARRYGIEAIQRHPASPEARIAFAGVLGREGRSRESEEVLRVAVSLAPTNVEAVVGLARVLFESGKVEEAEKTLRSALTETLKDPTVIRTLLARILLLQGDLPGAKEVLSEVPPSETSTPVNLQKCQIAMLEARQAHVRAEDAKIHLQEAQSILQSVSEKERESSSFQEVLGMIEFDQGKFVEAQRVFEPLLRVDTKLGKRQPGDESAYSDLTIASYLLHLGRCYMEQNFTAKARTQFVTAALWDRTGIESAVWEAITQIEGNDDKAASEALAKACERMTENAPLEWGSLGRRFYPPLTESRIVKLEEWSQKRTDRVTPRLVLAALAYRRGDYELCIRWCEEGSKTDPRSGLAHFLRAAGLEKQGKVEQAFEALQAARSADPAFRQASVRLARIFLVGHRPDLSAREYYLALQEHPRDVSLMVGLGGAYASLGKEDEAVKILSQALEQNPDHFDALVLLTQIYLRKGGRTDPLAYDELARLSDRILERRPDDRYALAIKGEALARKGDLGGAATALEKLGEGSPITVSVLTSLATVDTLRGKAGDASRMLETASKVLPASADLEISRAYVEMANGNEGAALKCLRNVKAGGRTDELVLTLEANALLLQGQIEETIATLGKIPTYGNETQALYRPLTGKSQPELKKVVLVLNDLGILSDRGWWSLAERRAAEMEEAIPGEPLASWWQALCALRLGRSDQALDLCRKVTDAIPGAGRAWAIQGTILAAKKQTEEAIECHRNQLELYRDNPQMVAEIHVLIGTLLDSLGRVQDGIREYKESLQHDPDNRIALNNLAWRLAETGDLDDGLTIAQKAVNTAPDQGDFRDTYGWIAYQVSKREENAGNAERASNLMKTAVEELGRASQLSPYNPSIRYRTGLALLETGDKGRALEQFRWAVRIGENFPEKAAAENLIKQTEEELRSQG